MKIEFEVNGIIDSNFFSATIDAVCDELDSHTYYMELISSQGYRVEIHVTEASAFEFAEKMSNNYAQDRDFEMTNEHPEFRIK